MLCFDKIKENEIDEASRKKTLITIQHFAAKKSKISGQLPIKNIFVKCKISQKLSKNLRFPLTLEMTDFQDIFYILLAKIIRVTINNL